jgi:hypothetical protein
MSKRKVISPCVSVCRIDDNNMCEGCGRSLKEIREWSIYSDKRRSIIMKRLDTKLVKQVKVGEFLRRIISFSNNQPTL